MQEPLCKNIRLRSLPFYKIDPFVHSLPKHLYFNSIITDYMWLGYTCGFILRWARSTVHEQEHQKGVCMQILIESAQGKGDHGLVNFFLNSHVVLKNLYRNLFPPPNKTGKKREFCLHCGLPKAYFLVCLCMEDTLRSTQVYNFSHVIEKKKLCIYRVFT